MIMDNLRACYTTRMRFFRDSDLEIPVKWYFVEEGALPFPHHHRFGSGNWATAKADWNGPGEVLGAPRPFYNGRAPRLACGDDVFGIFHGREFHGPAESYENGCHTGDTPLHAYPNGLLPQCMPLPPFCDLIILQRFDPNPAMPWFPGRRIRLYHWDVNGLEPLNLYWQVHADDVYYWQNGTCGPLGLRFICWGTGMALDLQGIPSFPDLVSRDRRTFFWNFFNVRGNCNPFPTAEHWRCIVTFNTGVAPMPNLFQMQVQNMHPGALAAGTSIGMHVSGLGVLPASASGTLLPAVGMTTAAIASGDLGQVQFGGQITLADWSLVTGAPALIPGQQYWLNPSFPGHVSLSPATTPGDLSQLVGEALTTQTMLIVAEPAVLL